jgi:hypothetical protein
MGYVQIGNKILVDGEHVANTDPTGQFVQEMFCNMCNSMKPYDNGFHVTAERWQCEACKAMN